MKWLLEAERGWLRTTNLGEGWFKHLRSYLSQFPGCRDGHHSEQAPGCFLLAGEQMHS